MAKKKKLSSTVQASLEGGLIEDHTPIWFDCPLYGKHITLEKDEKGNVYHRPWVFHFMYDHINKTPRKDWMKIKEHLGLWMWYFAFHDQDTAKELVQEWREKIG